MKQAYLIVLIVLGFGCSKNANKSATKNMSGPWEIGEMVISDVEVSIEFTNGSDSDLSVIDPMEKQVEVKEGDTWNRVAVLYCDCGSPCPAPPNEKLVEAGSTFTFSWDRKMEECKGDAPNQTTEKTFVQSGLYRISYYYRVPGERQKQLLQVEFEL